MAVTTYTQPYLPGFAPCEARNKNKIQKFTINRAVILQVLCVFLDGDRRYQLVGMPPDAQCVGMMIEPGFPDNLVLYISSCSFEEVPPGALVPDMLPTIFVTTDFYPVPGTEYYYKCLRPLNDDKTVRKSDTE